MRKKLSSHIFYTVLSLLFIASSCSLVAEKLEDCEDAMNTKMHFELKFTEAISDADNLDLQEIAKYIVIYVFDEDGNFANQLNIENPIFGHTYELDTLPNFKVAGKYEFVAWINTPDSYYKIIGDEKVRSVKKNKSELMLQLNLSENRVIGNELQALLHGDIIQQINFDGHDEVNIPVNRISNMINLTVEGLPANSDEYTFTLDDSNGAYDFEANYLDFDMFQYKETLQQKDELAQILSCSLRVLKISEDRIVRMALINQTTGKTIYPQNGDEDDLIEIIKKAYNGKDIDFDAKHNFNVKLNFQPDFSVIISIDDWVIDDSTDVIGN